ncbi:MAG: PEP-CTERM sorting domain-containing protein [Gemmataceae bacterium]
MVRPTVTIRGALALSVCLSLCACIRAGEVPGFGGVSSPHSNELATRNFKLKGKGILPVGLAEAKTEGTHLLSGSIYYMVYERDGRSSDDPWGTGGAQFTSRFRPGIDFNGGASPSLDTQAKYLYLYQVVNHQRTDPVIESASIKLLVDLSDVTSWGYIHGLGFATDEDGGIRPISANNKLDPNTYRSPAPAVPIAKSLRLAPIPTTRGENEPNLGAGKLVRIQWDAFDPARTPDYVMLLARSDFDEHSSFRAIWSGPNAIAKDGRSTVFGFTSNLPPKLDQARLRTSRDASKGSDIAEAGLGEKEGGAKGKADGVIGVEGQAPTPLPAAPKGGIALASTTTERSTSAGPAPFPPFFPPAGGTGTPTSVGSGVPLIVARNNTPQATGFGSGFGGGGSSSDTFTTNGSKSNVNININVGQSQSQQQAQNQSQNQGQRQRQGNGGGGHPPGNVVPEPATIIGGSIGLAALVGFVRRRRAV